MRYVEYVMQVIGWGGALLGALVAVLAAGMG